MASLAQLAGVTQSAIKGERGTGYEDENGLGEFECGNCEYFEAGTSSCGQRDMMKKSKRVKLANGRVKVEKEGCCEYVDRIGRVDDDSD